jgi:4-hydroxythreonine-4-phosphate dehydrogenase
MLMMQQVQPPVNLVITTGDPSGIGPEVSLAAAQDFLVEQANVNITLIGDAELLKIDLGLPPNVKERLKVQAIPLLTPAIPGVLNSENAHYVLSLLDQAIAGCLQDRYDAMITAPIQKSVINDAGITFRGHTEYLAQRYDVKNVVMMLCAPLKKGFLGIKVPRDLRVALVSTHLPLKDVPTVLTYELILETIQIVDQDLRAKFGIPRPHIRVAGLNPHAGESGYLGAEEIEIIAPAIEAAKQWGIDVSGPYPADTMFDVTALEKVDAITTRV